MLEVQKRSLKAGKQVGTEHVNSAIRNYKQERWVENSKRLGKEDSLSVWYSIEELQQFMEMAQDHGADGVKLYFGAYSQDHPENPLYAGRQTIVLVATKHKETENGSSNKDLYIPMENGASTIVAYNAGTICPPFCGMGSDFGNGIGIIVDKGEEGLVVA